MLVSQQDGLLFFATVVKKLHPISLCFLYKATFTILSRSDIDSFEHVMYQLPNAVQPTLCYTMFSRSLSNDWCTYMYTCHTQIKQLHPMADYYR